MPRCIYCTVEKDADGFNRDHVIPEAFGLFEGNFVLTCVCVTCNQFFGDTLELKLARDSLEGHDRVRVGLKDATDFRSLGKRSTTYVEFDGDSAVAGARGYLLSPKEGPELATTVMPRVGFRRVLSAPSSGFRSTGSRPRRSFSHGATAAENRSTCRPKARRASRSSGPPSRPGA